MLLILWLFERDDIFTRHRYPGIGKFPKMRRHLWPPEDKVAAKVPS
jgi:hypothetical protein